MNDFLLDSCDFKFSNYYLENNMSMTYTSTIATQGTYINLRVATFMILNSNFQFSYGLNGVIFINSLNKNCNIYVSNTNFTSLYSISNGGVFYYVKSKEKDSNITFFDCFFKNIFTLGSGALLYITSIKTSQVYFLNCEIMNIDSNQGSIIYNENSMIFYYNCSIKYNFDWYSDISTYYFYLYNKLLSFNTTTSSGSLIYLKNGPVFFQNTTITNITALNDIAPIVLDMQTTSMTLLNSTLQNISFYSCGFRLSNSIMISANSTFDYFINLMSSTLIVISNSIYGFIYMMSNSYISLTICNVSRVICSGCDTGAFIYSINSNFSIINTKLKDNLAKSGGVIYLYFAQNLIAFSFIINSTFTNNIAIQDGGVIYVISANLTIINTDFSNNSAENGYGGAIYYDNL